jgi:DNA-binding transcriptional regulator of glucitol operon
MRLCNAAMVVVVKQEDQRTSKNIMKIMKKNPPTARSSRMEPQRADRGPPKLQGPRDVHLHAATSDIGPAASRGNQLTGPGVEKQTIEGWIRGIRRAEK